jgi:hypothetical protein
MNDISDSAFYTVIQKKNTIYFSAIQIRCNQID